MLDITKEKDDEYDFMGSCPCCGSSDGLHVWLDDDDALGVHCFVCSANVKQVGEALGLLDPPEGEEPEPEATVRRVKGGSQRDDQPQSSRAPASWHDYLEKKGLDAKRLENLGLDFAGSVSFPFEGGSKIRTQEGEYYWAPKGFKATRHPIWPEIDDAKLPETIYLTEGETDMLTLRQQDLPAWTITAGASPKGTLSVSHYVGLRDRGVRTVILVHDADDAGIEWFRTEQENVVAAQLAIGRVDLSPHYDRWGYGIKDVNELWLDCAGDDTEFLDELGRCLFVTEPPRALELDDILELAKEDIEYLVDELVSPHEKGLIIGPQKTFKTWIALNLLKAVATGASFLDREDWTAEAGSPVLLIEEEGSKQKFARRIARVFEGVSDEHRDNFKLWFRHGFRLTNDEQVTELIAYIRDNNIRLVVMDPLQRLMPGIEENSAAETGIVWDNIHRIAAECAVIIVHHMNKTGGLDWNAIRGTSRTGGEVDFAMFVKQGEDPPAGKTQILMHVDGRDLVKHENEEGYLEIEFPKERPWELSARGWKIDISSSGGRKATVSQSKILEALAGGSPLSIAQLTSRTGLSRPTLERQLQRLADSGQIQEFKDPKKGATYLLTPTQRETSDD